MGNVISLGGGNARKRNSNNGGTPDTSLQDRSQDAMAQAFTEAHAHELKFVVPDRKWIWYNGTYWERDERQKADDLARNCIRRYVKENGAPTRLKSRANVKAILELASSDPRQVITFQELDTDPYLLNCPDGVYDLRTGERSPHSPDFFCTRIAAVTPSFEDAPLWQKCISDWSCQDGELINYLQKIAGYFLYGNNPLEVFFIAFGEGQNGKSKFKDVISHLMGSYATQAAGGLFVSNHQMNEDHALADLSGYRFAHQEENRPNVPLREDTLKKITGSNLMKVRPLYGSYCDVKVTFNVLLCLNYLPPLAAVDKAIKRRLHLIPYEFVCPDAQRDENLMQKLLDQEASEILGWAITGAVAFHQSGLNKPLRMLEVEKQYYNDQDQVARWMDECLSKGAPTIRVNSSEAYRSYVSWCADNGEQPLSNKALSSQLVSKGLVKARSRSGIYFSGWSLKRGDML